MRAIRNMRTLSRGCSKSYIFTFHLLSLFPFLMLKQNEHLKLHEPFCQPFGNRRLVHCRPASSLTPLSSTSPPTNPNSNPNTYPDPSLDHMDGHQGETPAWESCGRIVERERADFYEFVACNLGLAIVALFVLFARSKRLRAMHARQLAARIGLVRGQQ